MRIRKRMASELTASIPIFNLNNSSTKKIKNYNNISQNNNSNNILPLTSKINIVYNTKNCTTIKNKLNDKCDPNIIKIKSDSHKTNGRVMALRLAAKPAPLHVKHAHFLADIAPVKKTKPQKRRQNKMGIFGKILFRLFWCRQKNSTFQRRQVKHLCTIYFSYNCYPISNPTTLVTTEISPFISKINPNKNSCFQNS